jgi:hypothetical protein
MQADQVPRVFSSFSLRGLCCLSQQISSFRKIATAFEHQRKIVSYECSCVDIQSVIDVQGFPQDGLCLGRAIFPVKAFTQVPQALFHRAAIVCQAPAANLECIPKVRLGLRVSAVEPQGRRQCIFGRCSIERIARKDLAAYRICAFQQTACLAIQSDGAVRAAHVVEMLKPISATRTRAAAVTLAL